jgi:hypothetical protein
VSSEAGRRSSELCPGWDVTPDELEFLKAMERYQRRMHRRYPTWREVLAVLERLGYRKVARQSGPLAPRAVSADSDGDDRSTAADQDRSRSERTTLKPDQP